jgi:2-haloacid dehalogenase
VDVDAVEKVLADHVDDVEPISKLWRSRSLEYAMVANAVDAYEPFYELNRHAMEYALAAHGVELTAEEKEEVLSVYHDLDVFEDVRTGMERLVDAGYDLYVVSNGNPEMLESMIEGAEIGGLIEDAISADEVRTFKPDVEIYRHAAARTGTPIDRIAHASAGWFDVHGAMHAGMQGVWVDRKDTPWEPFGDEPNLTVTTFHELADELGV